MSPLDDVTRERVLRFLEALGREFRHPARVFLSGGEGMVWRGLRASTVDVDISYEVDPAHHDEWYRCLRDLKERLRTSIEEASPSDLIPMPPGHESRATHIGRFGNVDAFLLDPYAVALSRVERGLAGDLEDVRAPLGAKVLDPAELRRLFEAIRPAYSTRSLKADPARFRRGFEAVLRR